jgi:hypothetical protein
MTSKKGVKLDVTLIENIKKFEYEYANKQYTNAQIRKCILQTAKVYNIDVKVVVEQLLLKYEELFTERLNEIKRVHYKDSLVSKDLLSNPENIELPKEVRDLIFGWVEQDETADKTYKALLEVNKSVHKKQIPHKPKHFNQLWTLINQYPHKFEKHWENILKNPNTSVKHIEKFVKERGIDKVAGHKFRHNKTIPFWRSIALNPNWKDIKPLEKFFNIHDWNKVAYSSKFAIHYFETHPNNGWWSIDELSRNPRLTMTIVNKFPNKRWDWIYLSGNRGITMQDIIDNPDKPWDYAEIGSNPNLTIEFLDANLDKQWGTWIAVSSNANISLKSIEDRLDKPGYNWSTLGLSANPNLTMQFVNDHPRGVKNAQGAYDEKWSYILMSSNPGITIQDIENNPTLSWNWNRVLSNRNFTIEDAKKYINKFPDFFLDFSMNPNLTAEFVSAYINKGWYWDSISRNEFEKNKYYKK